VNKKVIVSIPCYFDGKFLPQVVDATYTSLSRLCNNFIISIVEDESDSSEIVNELKKEYPNLAYSRSNTRRGRGASVVDSWLGTQADVYIFMDADMATDIQEFDALRRLLVNVANGHYDFVTGSRYAPGAVVHRPLLRMLISRTYNVIVNRLFKTGIRDHQCGFKAFSRTVVENVLIETQEGKYTGQRNYLGAGFWDTKTIVAAKKKGYAILEIPVAWTEKKQNTASPRRMAQDIKYAVLEVLSLLRQCRCTH